MYGNAGVTYAHIQLCQSIGQIGRCDHLVSYPSLHLPDQEVVLNFDEEPVRVVLRIPTHTADVFGFEEEIRELAAFSC